MGSQGYNGLPNYYVESSNPLTPNLGLSLIGMDPIVAENFVLLDTAVGGPTDSIKVNGAVVPATNFINSASVTFSVVGSNVSATAASGGTPGGSDTQIQYNKSGVFGGDSNLEWNYTAGEMLINNTLSGAGTGPALAIGIPLGNPVSPGGVVLTGSSTFGAELEIHNPFSNGVRLFTHSNTGFRAPTLDFYRSEGTQSSPTAVKASDVLGYITYLGYDGSAYATGSQWLVLNGTQWSPSNHSTVIAFYACPAQSTSLNQVFLMNSNSDNGGDTNGNISRLSFYTNNVNEVTSAVQFLGFLNGDIGEITAFQNPSTGSLLLGNGSSGDFSGSLKLTGINIVGTLTDGTGAVGTNTQVLSSTAIGTKWVAAGNGTVTSVSSGNLDAIATVSVATATTTPAISFALATQSANTVWAGPTTGAAANPTFRALVSADIPNNAANTSGTAANLSGTPALPNGTTATTQSLGDNSTNIATDAFVLANALANPMTTAGDIIFENATPVATRLAIGTSGQVLTVVSGLPAWGTPGSASAVPWSGLTNATANLTLANAAFTTTFNQTSNVAWLWANTTTGTSITTNASPLLELAAQYFTGATTGTDLWTIGSSLAAGTNGASTLSVIHSGSTGAAVVSVPNIKTNTTGTSSACAVQVNAVNSGFFGAGGANGLLCSAGGATVWQAITGAPSNCLMIPGTIVLGFAANPTSNCDIGFTRLAAGSLALGNGTASNTTGNLSLNRINKAGADFAGQATVTAGNTTQAVTFAANYTGTGQPVIVLTPTSDPLALGVPVGYWVTYSGGAGAWSGFTVNIQTALAGNVTFNYIVVGVA